MKKSKTKAFTLVELLAVIAILGLVLIIAVPKVIGTMDASKKRTLELNVQSIIKAAEEKYLENDTFGIGEEITCENVSNMSKSDYESCMIKFNEKGEATVTIKGSGKFVGLYVCNGTKTSVAVKNDECLIGASYIATLCKDDTTCTSNNLLKDNDGNIRYYGSAPNNYIIFNDEVWRIIGVFSVKKDTTDTVKEQRIKIVRDELLLEQRSFASRNHWSSSDLALYLNGTAEGNYYYSLSKDAKSQIEDAIWNTSVVKYVSTGSTPEKIYKVEKNNQTEKSIVGLVNISDYGYAGGNTCTGVELSTCGEDNWMKSNLWYWTINGLSNTVYNTWYINVDGAANTDYSSNASGSVRPVVYLKSSVELTGTGENTPEGIYRIS